METDGLTNSWRYRLAATLTNWLTAGRFALGAVTAKVTDDNRGWVDLSYRPYDRPAGEYQQQYRDALQAWRDNPLAKRIISITTSYVVADGISLTSEDKALNKFIEEFWGHELNQRVLGDLEALSDELARAGDLFFLLFQNPVNGMSYVRPVIKDSITKIETNPDDYMREWVFTETPPEAAPTSSRTWYGVHHPQAAAQEVVMLHYAVNRPLGALMGESDLGPILKWLSRYSTMLTDRGKLNKAMRFFYWLISVPEKDVTATQARYAAPPAEGSIVVKSQNEKWEAVAPDLKAADAANDLKGYRAYINVGTPFPPFWLGEEQAGGISSQAEMKAPAERFLLRRQKFFTWMLCDITLQAYKRGDNPPLPTDNINKLFNVLVAEVSRDDNNQLATASKEFATASKELMALYPKSSTLKSVLLDLWFKFAGEPQDEKVISSVLKESENAQEQPDKPDTTESGDDTNRDN